MKMCSEVFQFEKELKWENPGPGIRRQIMGYDEQKEILSAGDGYYVAPNKPHGCVCLEAGVLIDTFTPMRADFL